MGSPEKAGGGRLPCEGMSLLLEQACRNLVGMASPES